MPVLAIYEEGEQTHNLMLIIALIKAKILNINGLILCQSLLILYILLFLFCLYNTFLERIFLI